MEQGPQLKFRNTRSRFYKPKPEESPDHHPTMAHGDEHKSNHWKEKGNEAFKNGNVPAAIGHYTKAIEIDPSESVYFSNRARCYFLQGNFEGALRDAQQSIELDDKSIKGQMICGCALAEIAKRDHRKIEPALKRLMRALTLCRGQNKGHFQEQVELAIYRAKKLEWYLKQEDERIETESIIQALNKTSSEKAKKLKALFEAKRPKLEVPDHLCCKITLELMEEPVVSSAGITYEKQALLEHYERNGLKDPFTNKAVSKDVYPNMAIKNAIKEFLEQNPWAFEHVKGENYMLIRF